MKCEITVLTFYMQPALEVGVVEIAGEQSLRSRNITELVSLN